MRSILLASFLALARSLPWPFSWDTVPSLAFPGAANRMMTEAEVDNFAANFSAITIWGLNATCINVTTGAAFPADCPPAASSCHCNVPEPRSVNQRFVQSMESSLRAQAVALKAAAAQRGKFLPVLGYIESGAMDQYSSAQARAMYDPALSSFRLSLESVGLVDCFRDGCNYQGVEFRQFDLRLPEVRAYVATQVLGLLVNDSALDGSFIDTLENQHIYLCRSVNCTPEEVSGIRAGSLLYLSAMLDAGAAAGKVISASCHVTPGQDRLYYEDYIAALVAHSNSSIRYWEFFSTGSLNMFMSEVAQGLAQHVHVRSRTLNPDWVELAAFLIGAGDHCYFSCSGPWNLDSFSVFPEFQKPLGKPLGAAVLHNGSWTRSFESLDVTFSPGSGEATLAWK